MSEQVRDSQGSRATPGRVLVCASLAATACFFNATAVNVLTATIAKSLQATSSEIRWVVLSYWLSLSVFTLCFGRVADIYGRKRLFCGGVFIFTTTACLGALSTNATSLILLRLIQGASAAAIFSNTAVLVADAYRGRNLANALARLAMVAAIAQALGPSLGSWLGHAFGWRSVFGASAAMGLVVFVCATIVLPKDEPPVERGSFDYVGALFSALGLGFMSWGLTKASVIAGSGVAQTEILSVALPLGISLASFLLLWKWVRTFHSPLIYPSLVNDPHRAMLYACVFATGIAQQGPIIILAIYFQIVIGVPVGDIGWRLSGLAIGMILGAPIAGWISRYVQSAKMCMFALTGVAAFSLATGAVVAFEATTSWLVTCLVGLGASFALFVTPCNQLLIERAPVGHRGIVNALRASLQSAGGLSGIAMVMLVSHAGLTPRARDLIYSVGGQALTVSERATLVRSIAFSLAVVSAISIVAAMLLRHCYRTRPPAVRAHLRNS